jgi:hypothetical protein
MFLLGGMLGHDMLGHNDDLNKSAVPEQFGKRRIDAGTFDLNERAFAR